MQRESAAQQTKLTISNPLSICAAVKDRHAHADCYARFDQQSKRQCSVFACIRR
jgi:hypothetical protein